MGCSTRERFIADLRRRLEAGQPELYVIRVDSVEEAATFVCAALLAHQDLSAASLVVTEPSGWRFVKQNAVLRVAVAARPEIAEKLTRRNGLLIIIPYVAGDMEGHYRGAAGRDGGAGQARKLADAYPSHARALHNSHANVAAALEEIARWYERDGLCEDLQAKLRRERYCLVFAS